MSHIDNPTFHKIHGANSNGTSHTAKTTQYRTLEHTAVEICTIELHSQHFIYTIIYYSRTEIMNVVLHKTQEVTFNEVLSGHW